MIVYAAGKRAVPVHVASPVRVLQPAHRFETLQTEFRVTSRSLSSATRNLFWTTNTLRQLRIFPRQSAAEATVSSRYVKHCMSLYMTRDTRVGAWFARSVYRGRAATDLCWQHEVHAGLAAKPAS